MVLVPIDHEPAATAASASSPSPSADPSGSARAPAPAPVAEGGEGGRDEAAPGNPEYRRAGLTAVALLAALNVADVVLTRLLLRRDAVELNPVAGALLESNSALLVKLIIVCVLAADFLLRRPRLPTLCLLWLVTGFYVCVVIVNGTQLVATWGS